MFLLSNYGSTFWASATFSCSASLDFVIAKLARLVVSDVTALVRLFRALAICASLTWG